MMKIAGYCRVSTSRQAEVGVSLEAQEAKIRAYCDAHGHELVALEVDHGLSAKSMAGRPALGRALALLKSGEAEGLVVLSLSRLSRSTRDLAEMVATTFSAGKGKRRAASLISLNEGFDTGTATGRMLVTVLGALAQLEREIVSERTGECLRYLKTQGRVVGAIAYGWRRIPGTKQVEPDPAEQLVIAQARELRAGGLTLRAVAAALTDAAIAAAPAGCSEWRSHADVRMKRRVDEVRVARALKRLDKLARDHPTAFDPARLPSTPAALAEALGEKRMGRPPSADRMQMMSVRVPPALLTQLDEARADRSRGMVVREALERWLRRRR